MDQVDIVTTKLKDELDNFAVNNNIQRERIDFELLEVITDILDKRENPQGFHLELADTANWTITDWLSPQITISQKYRIIISEQIHKSDLIITLHADKIYNKMYAIVRQNSKVKSVDDFLYQSKVEIARKKALHGILIGLFESPNLEADLSLIAQKHIKGVVTNDERLIVSSSPFPISRTVDQQLILDYKKNESKRKYDKNRGYLYYVDAGDAILTLIQAQKGVTGRNCFGALDEATEPKIIIMGKLFFTKNIREEKEIIDGFDALKYYAIEPGCISFDEFRKKLELKKVITVQSVDFKRTGDITIDPNADIELIIRGTNQNEDAIGQNMSVNVKSLVVDGHVGEGVMIKSENVEIHGSTHSSSKITADSVFVKVHRGNIKAANAQVSSLEGGEIEAKKIEIENALGGTAIGDEVKIKNLFDNTAVFGNESIHIENPNGTGNTLCIEFGFNQEEQLQIEKKQQSLNEVKKNLNQKRVVLNEKKKLFEKHKATFQELSQMVREYKQRGIEIPASTKTALQHFSVQVNEMKLLNESVEELINQVKAMEEDLASYEDAILSSSITVDGKWGVGQNKIMFKTFFPRQELSFVPVEGQHTKNIMLKRDPESGKLKIVVDNFEKSESEKK